jgi:two-component system response regulator YesN
MKIYEIAEAVGYSDAKYFARVFKEEQGISPGEYRQMN